MEYTLKKGNLTAKAQTKGGELISFKDENGRELLWQGDAAFWGGRNPNLFPIVGALKDGVITANGKQCAMGRHGVARLNEFTCTDLSEDRITLTLTENEETLKAYPFRFRFSMTHRLLDNGFATTFTVENPGEEPLPFCVGGHTAFNCPMKEGEAFTDYCIRFPERETANALNPSDKGLLSKSRFEPTLQGSDTIPLEHETYARVDTLVFDGLKSKSVRLLGPDGHGVEMDFSEFPMIAFWTAGAKKAPYICMEPWVGCAAYEDESGDFADKPYSVNLQPGERFERTYRVTLV